jgi:hypothetical protein
MSTIGTVRKGDTVTARVFTANPLTCLSGAQMKVSATARLITGTVTHIWCDDPAAPTKYEIAIRPEGEDTDVVVDPGSIIAVHDAPVDPLI